MLEHSEDLRPIPEVPAQTLRNARELLESERKRKRGALQKRESELDDARRKRQQATIETTLRIKLDHAMRRAAELEDRDAAPFAVRMAKMKAEKAREALKAASERFSTAGRFRIEDEEVAVGLLHVIQRSGNA